MVTVAHRTDFGPCFVLYTDLMKFFVFLFAIIIGFGALYIFNTQLNPTLSYNNIANTRPSSDQVSTTTISNTDELTVQIQQALRRSGYTCPSVEQNAIISEASNNLYTISIECTN